MGVSFVILFLGPGIGSRPEADCLQPCVNWSRLGCMGEPSFASLPSLLNIQCVVVMGGVGQEDSVVRDGALWELMVL